MMITNNKINSSQLLIYNVSHGEQISKN